MKHLATALITLWACGSSQQAGRTLYTVEDWDCAKRSAEYSLVGGFAAAESGIAISCEGERAFLEDWRVTRAGKRASEKHELSQVEFQELWKKLDSAGWRNLSDCDNPDSVDGDPVYTIVIRDHAVDVSLMCAGKGELPFPYNRLINELDLKSAGFTQ